jgi:HK97 family phage major capsid protein
MNPILAAILAQLESTSRRGLQYNLSNEHRSLDEVVRSSLPESVGGVCVPLLESRDLTATGGTFLQQGGNTIANEIPTIFNSIRSASVVSRMGATIIPGLRGNLDNPVFAGTIAAEWLAENAAATPQGDTFNLRSMKPHRVTAQVTISRQLLKQSPLVEEALVREIGLAIGSAIDAAAIAGTGTNQPRGILATNGIGAVTLGANGGSITHSKVCELEELVGDAGNVEDSRISFITSPKGKTALRKTFENSTGSSPVWIGRGSVLGHPAASSTAVPKNLTKGSGSNLTALLAGDFSRLLVGFWGDGLAIIVNPFKNDGAGFIDITVAAWVDMAVLEPSSFAAITDITTA